MRVDCGERHFFAFGGIMAFDGATGEMTLSGQVFGEEPLVRSAVCAQALAGQVQ